MPQKSKLPGLHVVHENLTYFMCTDTINAVYFPNVGIITATDLYFDCTWDTAVVARTFAAISGS